MAAVRRRCLECGRALLRGQVTPRKAEPHRQIGDQRLPHYNQCASSTASEVAKIETHRMESAASGAPMRELASIVSVDPSAYRISPLTLTARRRILRARVESR